MPRTNYYRNRKIDQELRGQAYVDPTTWYLALLSAASPIAHTEVTAGGVARVPLGCSLANWAGTQGAGTTGTSSGTSGVTTPNVEIEFVASATAAVAAAFIGFFDAASGGNLCRYYPIRDGAGNPITRTWAVGERIFIDNAAPTLTIEMT